MLPIAPAGQTTQMTLSGTPTALPAAITLDYYELWLSCTAGFNVQFSAGATYAFPLASTTVYRLPVQASATPLFSGSGTLSIMAIGQNPPGAGFGH